MAVPTAGDFSTIGGDLETTPRVYVGPTKWLSAQTIGLVPVADNTRKKAMVGSVNVGVFNKTTKIQGQGPIGLPLMPDNGAWLWKPAMGACGGVSALAADTIKAATPAVTALGTTTITLTNTGGVTYVKDTLVQIATGVNAEVRAIQSITGNSAPNTVITVPALTLNPAAAAGTAVIQGGQLAFTTNAFGTQLPTFSLEKNNAGTFAERIAGNFVDSWDVAAGKDEAMATFNTYSTVRWDTPHAPTTPAPSAAELADESNFFTADNHLTYMFADPLQSEDPAAVTGAAIALFNNQITDIKFSYKNNLIKYPTHDMGKAYRATRGGNELDVEYTYVNLSGRLHEFEDQINAQINKAVPFTFTSSNNQSDTSTAAMRAWSCSIPKLKTLDATDPIQVGSVYVATIKACAEPASRAADLATIHVLSAAGATPY